MEGGDHPLPGSKAQLGLCPSGQGCHRIGGMSPLELDMQLAASGDDLHHLPQGRDHLSFTGIELLQIGAGLFGQHPLAIGAALQPPVVEDPQLAIGRLHVDLDG